MLLCVTSAVAQIKIEGKITDNKSEPIPGVMVKVIGASTATLSDMDGNYKITVPSKESQLSFNFMGFVDQTITVGDKTRIDVVMGEDVQQADEVVVVGFGTMRKSDLTSSIAGVKGKDISQMTVGNAVEAMQGKVAGVQVVGAGGPGSQPKVLIRGFSSVNLPTDPLYVVDGIPMGTNMNFLNSNEIEKIEVLKDASASAIYGSRASNGVIMVTTKKGVAGKTIFNVDVSYGLQQMNNPYEMADAEQYARILNQASDNANLPREFNDPETYRGKTTDWWSAGIRQLSPQMNFSIGVQGGSEKHTYSVNLNYYEQDSFYEKGGWKKFTGRIANDFNFSKIVQAGVTLNPRYESWGNPSNWADFDRIDPITPIYKPESELTGDENEYSIYARSPSYVWNPVATVKRFNQTNESYVLGANAYVQVTPVKGLVIRSQIGATIDSRISSNFTPDFVIDAAHEYQALNKIERSTNLYFDWSWQNTITYMHTFNDKHNFTVMVGNTMEEWNGKSLWGAKYKLPNNSDNLWEVDAGTQDPATGGGSYTNSVMSFLGRLTYNFDSKYYITATFREDGSSKFLANNKWAFFPSASIAWRITGEEFMRSSDKWLDDLKLRVGWGRVGNQNLPAGVYDSKIGKGYYTMGDVIINTTYPTAMQNKDVKWETVEDLNAGIDFAMFGGRFSGSIEYYRKNTYDMLFQKKYPSYSGFPDDARIWTNVGSMRTQGFEFALTYNGKAGDFTYGANLVFTTFDVKMTSLTNDKEPLYGNDEKTKTVVGDVPGYFYGYVSDGLFQNKTEINRHTNDKGKKLQPYAQEGDIRFRDVNGDGVLNADDRTKIGSPWADFTVGLNLNFGYKGFDLLMNFYGSVGNELINQNKNELNNATNTTNKFANVYEKAWHGEGTSNDIPRLSKVDNNENYSKFSSFYVEDGSFLRLKNLQLGYTFLSNKAGFNKLRLYVAAQNLFTITKYQGIDPEVSGGVLGFGFGGWNYPVQRTFLLGVNISF